MLGSILGPPIYGNYYMHIIRLALRNLFAPCSYRLRARKSQRSSVFGQTVPPHKRYFLSPPQQSRSPDNTILVYQITLGALAPTENITHSGVSSYLLESRSPYLRLDPRSLHFSGSVTSRTLDPKRQELEKWCATNLGKGSSIHMGQTSHPERFLCKYFWVQVHGHLRNEGPDAILVLQ